MMRDLFLKRKSSKEKTQDWYQQLYSHEKHLDDAEPVDIRAGRKSKRRGPDVKAGQRYGWLTALHRQGPKWNFRCDCGNCIEFKAGAVTRGIVKSCGRCVCEPIANDGRSSVPRPEYGVWKGMIRRCESPKDANWKNYGGRGITVCKEWRASFETFYKDMGPRPSPKHSIERRDNWEEYAKWNCKWATAKEQAANTRQNVKVDVAGETMILAEAARKLGVGATTLSARLKRMKKVKKAY